MGTLNKVMLIGNLGKDAEVRYTAGGSAVGNFNLATTSRFKKKGSDQYEEKTEWHRVVVWGKQAESLQPYLKKGKQVYVEGMIETRSWEDKDGNKRYSTEIKADQITLLGGRVEGGGERRAESAQDEESEEVPF